MSITPETAEELVATYREIAASLDVDMLLADLMRPAFVYQNAKAKGDGFPGAKTTRVNAEQEIKRIVALHVLGRQDVLRAEQRQRIVDGLRRRQRTRGTT